MREKAETEGEGMRERKRERCSQPLLSGSGGQAMKQSCGEPMMDGMVGSFLSLQ